MHVSNKLQICFYHPNVWTISVLRFSDSISTTITNIKSWFHDYNNAATSHDKETVVNKIFATHCSNSYACNNPILTNCLLTFCAQHIKDPWICKQFMEIANNIVDIDHASAVLLLTCCKQIQCTNNGSHHLERTMQIVNRIYESQYKCKRLPDMKVLRLLIDCYSYCGHINRAKNIFNSIPRNRKNIVFITSMMKHLIAHNQNEDAIHVYEQYNARHDHVSNMLYLKACSNTGCIDKGKALLRSHYSDINQHTINRYDIQLICTFIDFYGRCGDIEDAIRMFNLIPRHKLDHICIAVMMNAYKHVNQYDSALDLFERSRKEKKTLRSGCLAIALHCSIKSQQLETFDRLLHEIISSESNATQYLDQFVFGCVVDGLIKTGQCHLFEAIWNMMTKCNIELNIDSYCIAILALSYTHHSALFNRFMERIQQRFSVELNQSNYFWNHLLLAYRNTLDDATMWNQYKQMRSHNIKPNLMTFCILASASDIQYKRAALDELKRFMFKYKRNWDAMDVTYLKGFYRNALLAQDKELIDVLKPRIEALNVIHPVIAEVNYNDTVVRFDNFYKYLKNDVGNAAILQKVDQLIREVDHTIDVSQHTEMHEDDAYKLISYHAEKKALAFVLSNAVDNITIKINLVMCNDCHTFFCKVSKKNQQNFIVIDPKVKHKFQNGHCSCSKYRYSNCHQCVEDETNRMWSKHKLSTKREIDSRRHNIMSFRVNSIVNICNVHSAG
eukprot:452450_1